MSSCSTYLLQGQEINSFPTLLYKKKLRRAQVKQNYEWQINIIEWKTTYNVSFILHKVVHILKL